MGDVCRSCGSDLLEDDDFCGDCGQQARCRSCRAALKPAKRFCTSCGTSIGANGAPTIAPEAMVRSATGMNTLEYREERSGRSLRATFTDETASNLVGPLTAALSGRTVVPVGKARATSAPETAVVEGEVLALPAATGQMERPRHVPQGEAGTASLPDGLDRIFIHEDGQLRLLDPRVKGTSKLDTARRVAFLYLYAQHQLGRESVPFDDVLAIVGEAGADDNNSRNWLRKTLDLRRDRDTGLVRLVPAGEELAKSYLSDARDPTRSDGWAADTGKTRGGKPSRGSEAVRDRSKPTRGARSLAQGETVSKWINAWKQKYPSLDGHDLLKDKSNFDQGIFSLWAIHESVGDRAISTKSIIRFLSDAFFIRADSRNLGRMFDKDKEKVLKVSGISYRITPSGIKYARAMAGLPPETLRTVPSQPVASTPI